MRSRSTPRELKALSLRDDLLNTFQLDEAQPSGAWRYRQIQLTPEGQLAIDLTFAGNGGFFVRRRTAVPEPTATTLLGLGFGLALLRRRVGLKGQAPRKSRAKNTIGSSSFGRTRTRGFLN